MAQRERETIDRLGSEGELILLVEDDLEMRDLMAAVLRYDGFQVVEAADGNRALEWLGDGLLGGNPERLPALIVSDIWLPYCSGLEILEGTRIATRRLPVVLITAFGDPETHRMARELGAVCVLDKPFTMKDLRGAVTTALNFGDQHPPRPLDGHLV